MGHLRVGVVVGRRRGGLLGLPSRSGGSGWAGRRLGIAPGFSFALGFGLAGSLVSSLALAFATRSVLPFSFPLPFLVLSFALPYFALGF